MKARLARLAGVLVLTLVGMAVPAVSAEEPGIITLFEKDLFRAPARTPVRFPHEAHWSLEGSDCLACHHDFRDGANVLDMSVLMAGGDAVKCSSCHRSAGRLEASFHLLCIGCHDGAAKKGSTTAPRTCGDCHPWK